MIENNKTGILVPSEDADILAEAIIGVLDNPAKAKAMGREARRFVEQHFTQQTMLEKTIGLYQQVMTRGIR